VESAARLGRHPIHPMLIPYPFAFLTGAAAFDLAARARQDPRLGETGRHLTLAGFGMALVAAVPGLIDYALTVPDGRPKEVATRHMIANLSAVGCFAGAIWARGSEPLPRRACVALELLGTALLSVGGWLGGSLSYHHGVGVTREATRAEAPDLPAAPARRLGS